MKLLRLLAFLPIPSHWALAHTGDHPHPQEVHLAGPVVTGEGRHRYETVPDWGTLPQGEKLGPTHGGVVIDKEGRLYVSTDAHHAVVVFDRDGAFLRSIAPDCVGIHALVLREEDGREFLYGSHLAGNRIVKLTLDGEVVLTIPNEETGEVPGGFGGLTGIAVGPDGAIFASCGYGSNMIHKFDPLGKHLKSVGTQGQPEEGKLRFDTSHGLLLDDRDADQPKLLVMDRENRRLVHLSLDLEWIGVHATGLRRPCAAALHDGFCAVAELEGRIAILASDGSLVTTLGDNPDRDQWANFGVPEAEMKPGVFTAPHGLCYDRNGNLYVQDWNQTGRLTKLRRLGGEP